MSEPGGYPPIAEHGLIGDLRTAALVSTAGVVDWYCPTRFDAPSVFAALLDAERGGYWSVAPEVSPGDINSPGGDGDGWTVKQLYLPDSAVLVTRFLGAAGVAEVTDFMPVATDTANVLVRQLRVVRGRVVFAVRCAPRFDYGRAGHDVSVAGTTALFQGPDLTLRLDGDLPLALSGADVVATCELAAGEQAWLALTAGPKPGPEPGPEPEPATAGPEPRPELEPVTAADVHRLFLETLGFWRGWVAEGTYRGRWRETVSRSAITLKLLTYAPTGAIVAAPTAGLPEQVGGERNWDYRYTWIRDASFTVQALLRLGYRREANDLFQWLSERPNPTQMSSPLQIMYRVDGSPHLPEEHLDHLAGYRGSQPVRIGNGAVDQLQLDIYGELVSALYTAFQNGERLGVRGWRMLRRLAAWLCANWDQPDEGIWETRGGRQNFVYGRVMSWTALDRMIRVAGDLGWPADIPLWTSTRDAIHEQVNERGWSTKLGAFVQAYDSDVLDAALLCMPSVGFLSDAEPAWRSTLSAIERTLVSDSLVYRYDPAASPDGLRGDEGTFSMCSFWYVEALARAGHLDEARLVFEKILTYANHLSLFAEELGPSGEQLGNFPQAFTHLALINAATTLDAALSAR